MTKIHETINTMTYGWRNRNTKSDPCGKSALDVYLFPNLIGAQIRDVDFIQ